MNPNADYACVIQRTTTSSGTRWWIAEDGPLWTQKRAAAKVYTDPEQVKRVIEYMYSKHHGCYIEAVQIDSSGAGS